MKVFYLSLALLGLLAALVYSFRGSDTGAPDTQEERPIFTGTTNAAVAAGNMENQQAERPLIPGIEEMFLGDSDPEGTSLALWEFADELGLSEDEAHRFFEVLISSNQRISSLAIVDDTTGESAPPMPEEVVGAVVARERALTEVLGNDGYRRYEGFSMTLVARKVINNLGRAEKGIGISPEQKAKILYGAYEKVERGGTPMSPHQFARSLNEAVLDGSAKFLSDEDQGRLAEAIEKDSVMRLPPEFDIPLPELPPGEGSTPLGAP